MYTRGTRKTFKLVFIHYSDHLSIHPRSHSYILLLSAPFFISRLFPRATQKVHQNGSAGVRSDDVCSGDVSCDVSPRVLCPRVTSPTVTWGFNALFVATISEPVVDWAWIGFQILACQVHNGSDKRWYPSHRGFTPTGPSRGGQVWFTNFCVCLS